MERVFQIGFHSINRTLRALADDSQDMIVITEDEIGNQVLDNIHLAAHLTSVLISYSKVYPDTAYPGGNQEREGKYDDENVSDFTLKRAVHLNHQFCPELPVRDHHLVNRPGDIAIQIKLLFTQASAEIRCTSYVFSD